MTAQANVISEQEALQKAQAFMQGKQFKQGDRQKTMRRAPQATTASAYYVFNVEDDGGFVIIAGDDAVDPVIGYATRGSFDDGNLPENVRAWLEQMSTEIKAISSSPAAARSGSSEPRAVRKTVEQHAVIEPLIITTWNQGNTDNVYNAKLPLVQGELPCTGCVATAGAQVMYYYHSDLPAMTQTVPGYTLTQSNGAETSADLPPIQFQWDKMKTKYSRKELDAPLSEEEKAVAELMLYCGWAAKMNYGLAYPHGGSSASTVTLADGMCKYFGFNPNTWQHVYRNSYSISEWDELIYNELASGRPVIYSGSYAGGHAFICDGYDGTGLYHFNWGWGGNYNGYFKLHATNPYGEIDPNDMGYIVDNDCIIGLQPSSWPAIEDPNADDTWEVPEIEGIVATASNVRIDGTTVTMRLSNSNEGTYGFGFGIGELNSDGTITPVDTSKEGYKDSSLGEGWGFPNVSFNFSSNNLPEGVHNLVPISIVDGESEWRRCKPADLYFEVTVTDGNKTIIAHPIENLQIDNFELVTGGTPGYSQTMKFRVTNNGDNIEKSFKIILDDNQGSYSWFTIKIAAGNTKEYRVSTSRLAAGTHTLSLVDANNTSVVLAQTEVTIRQELVATAFELTEPLFANSDIKVTATVENHAGDYAVPLYLFAGKSGAKDLHYVAGAGIESGSSEDVVFYFKPNATGTWTLYITTDSEGNNVIGTTTVDIADAPTGTVMLQLIDKKINFGPNGKVTYEMTVKNTGDVTNYHGVFVYLWAPTGEGNSWSTRAYQSSSDKVIEPGETAIFNFTFEGLTDGNEYSFDPRYYSTYQMEQYVRFNATFYTDRFTYQSISYILGDANGDDAVDIADAVSIVNYVVGKPNTNFNEAAADVNNDGVVDIADAVRIVNLVVGKISTLSRPSKPEVEANEPQ